jgi:hypothetical protein
MKRWFLRLALVTFALIWLFFACFPPLALILAVNDEIMIGQEHRSHFRLFMVSSDEHRGVGIEWSRRISERSDCYRSNVNFLLWEGDVGGQNVKFCHCLDQVNGLPEPLPMCDSSIGTDP